MPALLEPTPLASQAAATVKLCTHLGHAGRENAGERTASRTRPVSSSRVHARRSTQLALRDACATRRDRLQIASRAAL
eukprot:1189371-Prymnesium_polylepis.1